MTSPPGPAPTGRPAQRPGAAAAARRLSVAPMMDWTDRHCRVLHRRLAPHALLYTEMLHANALVRGDAARLLGHADEEHPLALQLGGSDPALLARAARVGVDHGMDEINLNCGCPSERVQDGAFGACLMREPALVAQLWSAAQEAAPDVQVTIKSRIGVDDQAPREALFALADACADAGCTSFTVHARKAWLKGLSPKENRDVPPLDYELVRELKRALPALEIVLNGGLRDLDHAIAESTGLDGVMLGRAAYQNPAVLMDVDARLFGAPNPAENAVAAVEAHMRYIEARLREGAPLHAMTRHMLGLFNGVPGGRAWRRVLSEQGVRAGAGLDVVRNALAGIVRPAIHAA